MTLHILDGRKQHMRIVLSLVMLLATAMTAYATPITYVHTGLGSGTLDDVAFGAAAPLAFTITAIGDTANVTPCPIGFGASCLFNVNTSASITINTIGTFDFLGSTLYFSNLGIVGFSRQSDGDLFNGPDVPSWDMLSSIGPIVGTGELLGWGPFHTVLTSGGVLFFNNGFSASTFTATTAPVPEPETYAMLLAGLGLLGLAARRRKQKTA